ncbi:hypothetical protein DENSPDRAFT_882931 [Dentipellis sp. KUC8613]|nr:hypothetical protein DENSPDRAFT_882931 [Dentipellis sp. KUC8613]
MAETQCREVGQLQTQDSLLTRLKHNAKSPLYRVPPEILRMMFEFDLDNSLTENRGRMPRSAVLSHVCLRWRSVSLEDRRLWTTISPDITGKWQPEFAARSGSLPLDVSIRLRPPQGSVDIGRDVEAHMVTQHVTRIRCLDVQGGEPFASSLVKKAAPKLETLSIHCAAPEPAHDPVRQCHIPVDIFANIAPRLHLLKLGWVRLPHTLPPPFENLKNIEAESSLSALGVWKLLPSTTHIETLRFAMVDSPHTDDTFSRTTPITAPALTTFVVSDIPVVKLVQMLANFLAAPSLSTIALCSIRISDLLTVYTLARALARHLPPHIDTLRQKHGPLHEAIVEPDRVVCWPTHLDTLSPRANDAGSRSPLTISWRSNDVFGYERLTASVLGMLPVDEVRTLHVSDRGYHPVVLEELWIRLYPAANVTVLHFAVGNTDGTMFLLQALTPLRCRASRVQWWQIGPRMPEDPLFPELEKLVFVAKEVDVHDGLFQAMLSRLAAARRVSGKPVQFACKKDHRAPEVLLEVKLADDAAD